MFQSHWGSESCLQGIALCHSVKSLRIGMLINQSFNRRPTGGGRPGEFQFYLLERYVIACKGRVLWTNDYTLILKHMLPRII